MKRIAVTEKSTIGKIIPKRGAQEVVIQRNGHTVALLVPMDDNEYEWYLKERDPAFIRSIAKARKQVREGKVTRLEKLKLELGIK